jgi:GT2 family glycosyltransferase
MFGADSPTRLAYVQDQGLAGLVEAKRAGVARANGQIVCFLEDDVILEADYLAQIEAGFVAEAGMLGCSGVITNLSRSTPYVLFHWLFFRGIFDDPRIRIFAKLATSGDQLIATEIVSGGLSAWRRKVFDEVEFDTQNGFFMLEDIDFSSRVVRTFGSCLFVNPRARLAHNWSPVNRDSQMTLQRRRLIEAITYYKKRRAWSGARTGLAMAMLWWLGDAVLQALRFRSPRPLIGYVRGAIDGFRRPLAAEVNDR